MNIGPLKYNILGKLITLQRLWDKARPTFQSHKTFDKKAFFSLKAMATLSYANKPSYNAL